MTKICLDQEITNAWFEMEGGGQIHLQSLTPEIVNEITKQVVKKKIEYKKVEGKAERFVYEDIDNDLQNELFWNYLIVDWKDLYDAKQIPIECTKENKILLMRRSKKFADFILESLGKLKELSIQQAEEAEKNL